MPTPSGDSSLREVNAAMRLAVHRLMKFAVPGRFERETQVVAAVTPDWRAHETQFRRANRYAERDKTAFPFAAVVRRPEVEAPRVHDPMWLQGVPLTPADPATTARPNLYYAKVRLYYDVTIWDDRTVDIEQYVDGILVRGMKATHEIPFFSPLWGIDRHIAVTPDMPLLNRAPDEEERGDRGPVFGISWPFQVDADLGFVEDAPFVKRVDFDGIVIEPPDDIAIPTLEITHEDAA